MKENTITKDAIVQALQVLTGMPWEHYNGEIFTGADNGDLLALNKNPDLTAAGVEVEAEGLPDSPIENHSDDVEIGDLDIGYRIILQNGYNADKLIELSDQKIQSAGGREAVMKEWRRLKNEGSSQDPEAMREATAALNALYPDGMWENINTAVRDPHVRYRMLLYSHALPKERAEEIEQFLKSIGIDPMVELHLGDEEQEVGISYFDAKAFAALKAVAAPAVKAAAEHRMAMRAAAPEFMENPAVQYNDSSLPIRETENPILLRAAQIQAKTVTKLGEIQTPGAGQTPAA